MIAPNYPRFDFELTADLGAAIGLIPPGGAEALDLPKCRLSCPDGILGRYTARSRRARPGSRSRGVAGVRGREPTPFTAVR
jgi:hypothetical protein